MIVKQLPYICRRRPFNASTATNHFLGNLEHNTQNRLHNRYPSLTCTVVTKQLKCINAKIDSITRSISITSQMY